MYALVPTRPDWTRIFHTFCRNENHFILELPVRAAAAGPRSPDGQDFPDFLSCETVWRIFFRFSFLLPVPCSFRTLHGCICLLLHVVRFYCGLWERRPASASAGPLCLWHRSLSPFVEHGSTWMRRR